MGTKPIGILKATPEDFVVQELVGDPPVAVPFSTETRIHGWDGKSAVTVFEMSKRGWETRTALKEVARQLDVSEDDISQYGLKDKVAETTSLICVRGKFRPTFSHPDIRLVQLPDQDFGWVNWDRDNPWMLRLGGNAGNRFSIFVRTTATTLDLAAAQALPNMFGPQRLGQPGSENVGRLLLEDEPAKAVEVLLTTPGARDFRRILNSVGGSCEKALSHPDFSKQFGFEVVKWQSYLWNKLLQEKLEKLGNRVPDRLPMWNLHPQVYEMYQHLWDPNRLNDWALERIAVSGGGSTLRRTVIRPENFQAKREAEGWRFTFDLPPGAYATEVLDQMFQLEEARSSRPKSREVLPQISAADRELADDIARIRKMLSYRI